MLDWDINSIFYFRTKVDLAALAFRDYDPYNKKQNLLRYMQLNILWQWNQQHAMEVNNYCQFKYRFRMGNHKIRLLAVPQGPSTVFHFRWGWRPTEHLHFAFQTFVRPSRLCLALISDLACDRGHGGRVWLQVLL